MTENNDTAPAEPTEPVVDAVPPPFEAPAADAPAPEAAEAEAVLEPVAAEPVAAAPVDAPHAPYAAGPAPLGKIRGTGACILLTIVTLGFYSLYWYYKTSQEMKEHSGEGIGGGIALILAIVVGFVMPFISSNEAGKLYQRRGQQAPVSAATGLWFLLLGWFFFVGCIVWFVKTNGALNDYWRSQGQTAS